MRPFSSSLFTAVTLVLVTAGLSFGQTATATWPLESSTSVTVSGNVTADSEAVVGLEAAYEVPPAGTTLNVQKLKPDTTTSGTAGTGSWPVETALNPARYVEFSISPKTSFSLDVTSISMMVGAKGIKGMNASIFYSMNSDFSDSTELVEVDSLLENAVMDTTFDGLSLIVNSGDTLFVRVFPWTQTSSTSTTKYMYIGDMVASGIAVNPSLSTTGLWDFQADSIGFSLAHMGWYQTDIEPMIAKDTITPSATNHVLECMVHNYNAAPVVEAILPAGKTLADYSMFNFRAYFAQGDVGYKTIYVAAFSSVPSGPFENNAPSANTVGSLYRAQMGSTGWENISIPISGSFSMTDTVYLAFGISCAATGNVGGTNVPTVWYADSIQLVPSTSTASPVTLWGIAPPRNNPGWHLTVSSNGDTANFHGGGVTPWAGIRGAFKRPLVGTTAANGAVVASGKVTFVGEGPDVWSGLRYGIFNNLVPGTLSTAVPDSAYWDGFAESSYGYMFTPQSGTAMAGNIPGGTGATQGITMGGSWISTYGGAIGFGPPILQQAPARATMNAGTYDFAFSVHPLSDGTKRVNFYLIQKDNSGKIVYWYGGSLIDTTSQMRSDTLNAVCFGVEGGTNMTGMILFDVVDSLGPDIAVPQQPWQNYYISDWGIYGKNSGGWVLTPGSIIGNTTISGDTAILAFQHASVLGALVASTAGRNGKDSTLIVTGDLQFVGGGFEALNSFSFGLFSAPNKGSLDSTQTVGYQWTGANDGNDGYLFIPPSGNNPTPIWQTTTQEYGNVGAVVGQPWQSTAGKNNYVLAGNHQMPIDAMADTGNYVFAISVAPQSDGSQLVSATLYKPDSSYVWGASVLDNHSPLAAQTFNSVVFGLTSGNATTALNIANVQVELGPPVKVSSAITGVANSSPNLPKTFAMYQNYPNPFNPSTTIRYDIPMTSQVTVTIYDILGRVVTTLVNGVQAPSSYTVQWNAQRYSSGVYFCRIEARAQDGSKSFASVKKILFMK